MNKSYLYTETAFHHQGDINHLKQLISESKKSGAHGIKFQVLTEITDFVSVFHTAFDELKSYCLTLKEWDEIFDFTSSLKLDIIMMPLNIQSLELTKKHSIKYLDIHSVSFNDTKLLEAINETNLDIILGVGGRELNEIYNQISFFKEKLKVLMVGFQSFPSKLEKVKISKISILKTLFPDLKIGYADHSAPEDPFSILSNDYARVLGATIFEKHITLDENEKRIDSASAVGSDKIKEIVTRLEFIDAYVTNQETAFHMEPEEVTYRNRQLICVSTCDLNPGELLNPENVALKMVSDPEDCFTVPIEIYSKSLKKSIKKDEPIKTYHI